MRVQEGRSGIISTSPCSAGRLTERTSGSEAWERRVGLQELEDGEGAGVILIEKGAAGNETIAGGGEKNARTRQSRTDRSYGLTHQHN